MPAKSTALIDPRFENAISLVEQSLTSANSKRAYRTALTQFLSYLVAHEENIFSRQTVQRFRKRLEEQKISSSTINSRLCAVRKLADEMQMAGQLDLNTSGSIQKVKGTKRRGKRIGNWLTREQCQTLLAQPDSTTIRGLRDRAIIGIFLGCGLRRSELSKLNNKAIQQRDGRWVIVDLLGKGETLRTVPMPNQVKVMVDSWLVALREAKHIGSGWLEDGTHECVFVPLTKGLRPAAIGSHLSAESLYDVVAQHAAAANLPNIHPHDLRRTFARLVHKARAPIDQIKETLGHASMQTTEIYIGSQQNLASAPCDLLDIWE